MLLLRIAQAGLMRFEKIFKIQVLPLGTEREKELSHERLKSLDHQPMQNS
jgi:hypothetical protein